MAQKLEQKELENVSGGACEKKEHVIKDTKVEIRYKMPNGNKINTIVIFHIYEDTERDVHGVHVEYLAKNWCKEKGFGFIWYSMKGTV